MDPDEHDVHELDVDGHSPEDIESATREALRAVAGDAAVETAAPGPSPLATELSLELQRVEGERNTLRERNVRLLADFENFRKRAEREREDVARYALAEPLRDFLSVVDNLDRALSVEGGKPEDLKAGVEMIGRQMRDLLRRHQVKEVLAEGQPFDPALHEAVMRVEDSAVSLPQVAAVFQRGYLLHDRLLRPAMVKVAVPAATPVPVPPEPAAD